MSDSTVRNVSILTLLICSVVYGGLIEEGPGELSTVEVGDITIGYRIFGNGYPLVMITGFSGTMDMWAPVGVSMLSDHYRIITFDNRGMGETTSGTNTFSIEQFADDTAGLMDALGIVDAHVLSWSMGTEIALELVLSHPDKVNRLILYAGDCQMNACPPSPDVLDELYDTSGTQEERGERLLRHMFPDEWLSEHLAYIINLFSGFTGIVPPENVAKQSVAMETWPGAQDRLPLIDTPVLLITGTEDILTPPQNSLILLEGLPDAELVEIEGGGHGVMYQYPEEFTYIVLNFLAAQN